MVDEKWREKEKGGRKRRAKRGDWGLSVYGSHEFQGILCPRLVATFFFPSFLPGMKTGNILFKKYTL